MTKEHEEMKQCREAFETNPVFDKCNFARTDAKYTDRITQGFWLGFQAAWQFCTTPPQADKPCPYVVTSKEGTSYCRLAAQPQAATRGNDGEENSASLPDRADGLEEDLRQLIRVALTNPAGLHGFIQANYPKEYADHEQAAQPVSTMGATVKRLKTAIGGLRSIAYGDAQTWPNCSSREVAKQALKDCGGEKITAIGLPTENEE